MSFPFAPVSAAPATVTPAAAVAAMAMSMAKQPPAPAPAPGAVSVLASSAIVQVNLNRAVSALRATEELLRFRMAAAEADADASAKALAADGLAKLPFALLELDACAQRVMNLTEMLQQRQTQPSPSPPSPPPPLPPAAAPRNPKREFVAPPRTRAEKLERWWMKPACHEYREAVNAVITQKSSSAATACTWEGCACDGAGKLVVVDAEDSVVGHWWDDCSCETQVHLCQVSADTCWGNKSIRRCEMHGTKRRRGS